MLDEINIEQSFKWLKNIGSQTAEASGQFVALIEQNRNRYVAKYLTHQATSLNQKRFQYELEIYQRFQSHEWCSDFLILKTSDIQFKCNPLEIQITGQVLLLPFYETLKTLNLSKLSLDKKLELFQMICHRLMQLHQCGYIYADLKQSHIALHHHSIKFLDLAFLDQNLFDESGGVPSTPAYMAPELFNGHSPTVQSDIYALGLLFYEILMGEKVYKAKTYINWALMHCQSDIPLLQNSLQTLQPLLDGMLAKRKENRFYSIEDIICLLNKRKSEI